MAKDKDQELRQQYKQLEMDFLKEFTISPLHPYTIPDRLYSFPEFLKHPFFLNKNSQAVTQSRKGYNEKEIKKRLSKAKKSDGTAYTQEEINNAVKVSRSDLVKEYEDGWQIIASIEYGLPTETDGHVWDYLVHKISQLYLKEKKFFSLYFFTEEEIMKELIKWGVLSNRGGKQKKIISDSISRLHATSYRFEKGIKFRTKKGEQGNHEEEYTKAEFNLISAIFQKGQTLPDGTKNTKIAIAINPIIIKSLREEHFFIIANKKRQFLSKYGSKVLYDRLAFWAYINYKSQHYLPFQSLGIPAFQTIGYEKLCELLGLEPLKSSAYKRSRIEKQLKVFHQELLDMGLILWIDIDEVPKKRRKKEYRFVYVFSEDFIKDITSFQSKTQKIDQRFIDDSYQVSTNEMDSLINFVNSQIHSEEIRKKLFEGLIFANPQNSTE